MRRVATILGTAAVVMLTASVFAQTPNFAGKWTRDAEKTAAAMPAGAPAGGGGGRGGGGGGSSRAGYEQAGEYLRRLATDTGGRHHDAADLRNVEQAFNNIAEELRRQYSLGYYPSRHAQSEERRQIKVRVRRPNLVVRARDSYVYRPDGSAAPPSTTTAQDNTGPRQTAPVLRPRNLDSDRGLK